MKLEFYPVTQDRWKDFERLFESKGAPHNCWCTVWRYVEKKGSNPDKTEKKASMKARVDGGVSIGILAYADNEPIAWCSIAPRETYRSLSGCEAKEKVWSIVCFFIKRPFRNIGLSNLLLEEAIKYAKDNGAKYVEAYPVDPDSPSYRFMGFKPTFEKAKFTFVKKAGKRRNVMLLEPNENAPNKAKSADAKKRRG